MRPHPNRNEPEDTVRTGLPRATPLAALLAVLAVLAGTGACDSPSPAPPVESAGRDTSAPATASPSASSVSGPVVVGPAPADLHDVDWARVPVPGTFCDVPGLVRFGGEPETRATSTVWGTVRVSRGKHVLYGDTDGDGRDEAAVYVGCRDTVTMNAQITSAYVVYTHQGDNLAALGTITPRRKAGPYPTMVVGADFEPGRIVVHEKWWRTNDPHCCPSGDATTVWSRVGDRLTAGTTRVTS